METGPKPAKRPRKSKLLRKTDKQALLDVLGSLPVTDVVASVITKISKENHVYLFKDREKLWKLLQNEQSLMSTLVQGLIKIYIGVYQFCQKGKDKYCRFQLEWHRKCSLLLTDQVDKKDKDISPLHQSWLEYCKGVGVSKEAYNPMMVAIYSAVFDCLMEKVVQHQKGMQSDDDDVRSSCSQSSVDEKEGVYYRFGGAALCSMLHLRYDQLKPNVSIDKQECIKHEIAILKAIQCFEKQHVPLYLLYRDKGYMYFPAACYILFIRNVDRCVLQYANEASLKQFGSKLVEVATTNLRQNSNLEVQFNSILQDVYNDYEDHKELVHNIFTEFTRKLCNTRIQEFLDAHRQLAAKDGGKTTLSGQNLRDKLLTYHTK